MFTRISQVLLRIILIITILDLTGGQWFILQSIAWYHMTVINVQTASLKNALVKTFDGRHPCEMCEGIQKAKRTEKKQEAQQISLKMEFLCEFGDLLLFYPPDFLRCGLMDFTRVVRENAPLVPPPRSLLG